LPGRDDAGRLEPGAHAQLGAGAGHGSAVVLSLSNAAVDRARNANPKSKANTKSFRQRFLSAHGGRERLHALIFAKTPEVLDLGK